MRRAIRDSAVEPSGRPTWRRSRGRVGRRDRSRAGRPFDREGCPMRCGRRSRPTLRAPAGRARGPARRRLRPRRPGSAVARRAVRRNDGYERHPRRACSDRTPRSGEMPPYERLEAARQFRSASARAAPVPAALPRVSWPQPGYAQRRRASPRPGCPRSHGPGHPGHQDGRGVPHLDTPAAGSRDNPTKSTEPPKSDTGTDPPPGPPARAARGRRPRSRP